MLSSASLPHPQVSSDEEDDIVVSPNLGKKRESRAQVDDSDSDDGGQRKVGEDSIAVLLVAA